MKKKTRAVKDLNVISRPADIVINIIFTIFMLICILPLILVLIISFTEQSSIIKHGYSFFPEKVTLKAYQYLFSDPKLVLRSYVVSIIVTVIGVILNGIISALFAYPISRKDFPFRKFFTMFIAITMP